MKRTILLIVTALAAALTFAAEILPGSTWDVFVGTRKHSEHPTLDKCVETIEKQLPPGQYGCRHIARVVKTAPPTTPPPVVTPPVVTPPTTPSVVGIPWNPALVPAPNTAAVKVGDRVRASSIVTPVAGDGVPIARMQCAWSHFAYDDPLVFPGQVRRSHGHMFWGNTGVNANTTNMRSDRSTCVGGSANTTGYWIPALIDTTDGRPLTPNEIFVYYKGGYQGVRPADFRVWGNGLRMLAGDATATTVRQSWERAHTWTCDGVPGRHGSIPPDCTPGGELNLDLIFPQCWDGVNLDSPDHKSHMAYPSGNGCPASHPVAIPEITYVVMFRTPAGGSGSVRLTSDQPGAPAGTSMHGDWWDGWNPERKRHMIANCHNQARDCGTNLLGGGLTSY